MDEDYLYFSPDIYKRRKEVAQKRLEEVLHFVQCEDTCRSQLLLAYFGEHKSPACGKCDVCLKVHKEEVNNKDFKDISTEVKKVAVSGIKDIKDLIIKVSQKFTQEKVVKVVRWMIDNGQLNVET